MKIVGRFLDVQEVLPSHGLGIDHGSGSIGLVLVMCSSEVQKHYREVKLVWRKGGTHFSFRGEHSYHPACLNVEGCFDGKHWVLPKTIFEGGRLTKDRLKSALNDIRAAMGLSVGIERIDPKRTYLITEIDDK